MHKKIGILLLILVLPGLLAVGCTRPKRDVAPDYSKPLGAYAALDEYAANLQAAAGAAYKSIQDQLGHEAVLVSGQVVRPVLDEAFIQGVLNDLRAKAPVTAWCWQNAQGTVVFSNLINTIGQPGGANEIVNVAYQNNAVYASNNIVSRVEAQHALVIVIPVVDYNQAYGAFVGVVSPELDLGAMFDPYIEIPKGMVVMNLQSGIIFSDTLDEIGRNYLNDEFYKPFGDLLLAVNKMRSQSEGMARYYYYVGNTPYKDWYNCRWVSVQYFSHTWRFIMREPASLDLQTTY